MRNTLVKTGTVVLALVAALAVRASAHHSFAAEYDAKKPVTLKGTVTKVEWVNPHGWIYIDVKAPNGKVANSGSSILEELFRMTSSSYRLISWLRQRPHLKKQR